MTTNEPLWTVAGLTAGVTALLVLLVSFGVPLTPDQQTAIVGVIGVLAPTVVALLARSRVTANANVVALETTKRDETVVVAGAASPLPNGTPVSVLAEHNLTPEG